MKAYKFDRCGCYFSDKKTVYSGVVKLDADFCPECVRSFEKWLKMDNAETRQTLKYVDTDTAFGGLQSAT